MKKLLLLLTGALLLAGALSVPSSSTPTEVRGRSVLRAIPVNPNSFLSRLEDAAAGHGLESDALSGLELRDGRNRVIVPADGYVSSLASVALSLARAPRPPDIDCRHDDPAALGSRFSHLFHLYDLPDHFGGDALCLRSRPRGLRLFVLVYLLGWLDRQQWVAFWNYLGNMLQRFQSVSGIEAAESLSFPMGDRSAAVPRDRRRGARS